LATAFQVAGKVASANIITRGPRSLGYGFVEMESEEDAQHAVAVMNKKLIDDREINVEVAKAREETLDRPPPRPRRPRVRGEKKEDGATNTTAPANNNSNTTNAPKDNSQDVAGNDERRIRRRRRRLPTGRGPNSPTQTGGAPGQPQGQSTAPGQPQGQPREDRVRGPRRPRKETESPSPRNPSKTTLFVANLPFAVDDDGLAKIFAGLNIKSAHVVKKRNGRSKGFGFVEFDSEDAQNKAKNAVDKKLVEDRELIVKVALTENQPPTDSKEEKKPEAPKAQ